MKTLSFEQMEVINAGWPEWLVKAWDAVCDVWNSFVNWIAEFYWDVWDSLIIIITEQ